MCEMDTRHGWGSLILGLLPDWAELLWCYLNIKMAIPELLAKDAHFLQQKLRWPSRLGGRVKFPDVICSLIQMKPRKHRSSEMKQWLMEVDPAGKNLSSISLKMASTSSDSMVFSIVLPFCCIWTCIKVPGCEFLVMELMLFHIKVQFSWSIL